MTQRRSISCPPSSSRRQSIRRRSISNGGGGGGSGRMNGKPSVIVFDLDGCLWKPEMFELIFWRPGGDGGPFRPGPDGTLISRNGEAVYLIGDVRTVMRELYCDPTWKDTKVGISSRTHGPDMARELIEKFEIGTCDDDDVVFVNVEDDCSDPRGDVFTLSDVFERDLCELAEDVKAKHLKRIAKRSGVAMNSILFFDNEAKNCREVAKLGVTAVYCPMGVTMDMWDRALKSFPSTKGEVVGM